MPTSHAFVGPQTPLGANLVAGGATFRTWAPVADDVFVLGDFNGWAQADSSRLVKDASGYWAGFVSGVKDGSEYKFFVVGKGSSGFKRDPYARELTFQPEFPHCNCIVRDPGTYLWHDAGFRPPAFNDLVIYQLHVGSFSGADLTQIAGRPRHVGTFLDAVDRLEYLVELGVNAIEPLPITEFPSQTGMGYSGTDLFSPEMAYAVQSAELPPYLQRVNRLLANRGQPPLPAGTLDSQINQLKVMVDLYHLYGIAVLFDVVYNHAGGDFGDESIYFFDRQPNGNNNHSLYFTNEDEGTGGLIFAYWQAPVRQFLIDNMRFFFDEYHIDGYRYDEVSIISRHGGWGFCQDLTSTARFVKPSAPNIAEFWGDQPWVLKTPAEGGAGFDAVWSDRMRESVRSAVGQAAAGQTAWVNLDGVRDQGLIKPIGFAASWKCVQAIENHDEVYAGRQPRIPALADGGNHRSWYARSRAKVATGLLLMSPGIPLLFMGQEFLEDEPWSDSDPGLMIWWNGIATDKAMQDQLRFTRELISVRRRYAALRGEPLNVFKTHDVDRMIAFHRRLDGMGDDVVVVASLNENTFYDYRIGFPRAGRWFEIFNSDVYDNWVNPVVKGNGGQIWADSQPMDGLPASASIVIPANTLLVFSINQH